MTFSRSAKRLLAGIASAFLLLCQTAMVAQACALAPAAAGESALSDSCHGVAPRSGDAPGHAKLQDCPSEYASANFAKLDVPQVSGLPALPVQPIRLRAPVRDGLSPVVLPARAEPPPLTIVHCCLRN